MKHRKLRIAWSVACGIAAVLLVALWVRSCWTVDKVNVPLLNSWNVMIGSLPGVCGGELYKRYGVGFGWGTETSDEARRHIPQSESSLSSGIWGRFAYVYERGPGVILPDWFLIGVAVVLSGAPWLRWTNRFSRRTLLIATTLVAVGLGLIASLSSP